MTTKIDGGKHMHTAHQIKLFTKPQQQENETGPVLGIQ